MQAQNFACESKIVLACKNFVFASTSFAYASTKLCTNKFDFVEPCTNLAQTVHSLCTVCANKTKFSSKTKFGVKTKFGAKTKFLQASKQASKVCATELRSDFIGIVTSSPKNWSPEITWSSTVLSFAQAILFTGYNISKHCSGWLWHHKYSPTVNLEPKQESRTSPTKDDLRDLRLDLPKLDQPLQLNLKSWTRFLLLKRSLSCYDWTLLLSF